MIVAAWVASAIGLKGDSDPPHASILHGGELIESPSVEEHGVPHYQLTWILVDDFQKVDPPGFWAQWWAAFTDWSFSNQTQSDQMDWEFQVQRDTDAGFPNPRNVYLGADNTSFISGMDEQTHFFRVRTVSPDGEYYSDWSPSLGLAVNYPSQTRAFALFGVGALVTIITIATILIGAARTREEGELQEKENNRRDREARNS